MYVCYVSTNKCCIVYNSYAEEPILNKKFHQYQTPSQLHKEYLFHLSIYIIIHKKTIRDVQI